jgi:tRNA-specific adenosine deaminase 1
MKNDMMLIMENWRKGQEKLLLEGKILDWIKQSIKKGFERLTKKPEAFDAMVEDAKASFEEIMMDKLKNNPEFQAMGKEAAEAINTHARTKETESLNEGEEDEGEYKWDDDAPVGVSGGYGGKAEDIRTARKAREEKEQKGQEEKEELSDDDLREIGLSDEQIDKYREKLSEIIASSALEAAEKATGKVAPPEVKDFLVRFLKRSSKMIAFGFVDNFIMITAGDYIDPGLKNILGTSTMFAAGIGNMISDVAGEEAGSTIDNTLEKMGLDIEGVSDEQMELAPGWMQFMDRRAGTFGVAIGCLLGMIPLAFMEDKEKDDRETLI